MSRIPYLIDDKINLPSDLLHLIKQRRPNGKLFNLDRILAYSEPLIQGWQVFFSALRTQLSVPSDLRELVCLRVAQLNHASYEMEKHAPLALQEGITQAQIDALNEWPHSALFDEKIKSLLAYTEAMTLSIQVPDIVFQRLSAFFSEQETVEFTSLIAAYNMVSRFLEALQITSAGE